MACSCAGGGKVLYTYIPPSGPPQANLSEYEARTFARQGGGTVRKQA